LNRGFCSNHTPHPPKPQTPQVWWKRKSTLPVQDQNWQVERAGRHSVQGDVIDYAAGGTTLNGVSEQEKAQGVEKKRFRLFDMLEKHNALNRPAWLRRGRSNGVWWIQKRSGTKSIYLRRVVVRGGLRKEGAKRSKQSVIVVPPVLETGRVTVNIIALGDKSKRLPITKSFQSRKKKRLWGFAGARTPWRVK